MHDHTYCIPYVGGIIERDNNGAKEVFIQTRWKPTRDPLYSGTLEFPAGVLDIPFENVFEALKREIKEETGLKLKSITGESKTDVFSPKGTDASFGFKPFCCTQQLKEGKPWVGFTFICEVEDGDIVSQEDEAKDGKWIQVSELHALFVANPEKFFALQISAWEYYFKALDK